MSPEQIIHVVDDDQRFLAALELSLHEFENPVRAYRDAQSLLARFDPHQPGCLITDLRMPSMDGLELQSALRKRGSHIPVIFITGHGDTAAAVKALKGGAVDFLEKPFKEDALFECVRRALQKDATDRALLAEKEQVQKSYADLSPREREVFALVVSDRSNKEIARHLKISPRTVEHHREHVMLKMRANSLAELITMAVLCGIHELHLQ